MSDTTHTIWRSAARFFSGTMLSRISGLARDMAMAYAFGTQSAVAALLVAFRFAHLLRRLLGEGAMQTALIPHFEELRAQDPKRAGRFFCDLAFSLTGLLFLLILAIMGAIGGLLAFDVLNAGNADIAWLTLLMMPSLLFICLFGINASLLQCEKSYFVPSAAPVVFNLCWIAGVACTYFLPAESAMTTLALFIIAACFAQWAITLPKSYTLLKGYGLTHLWNGTKWFSADVLRLAKPLSLGILGIAASQINNALDAVFARWADAEGPALLWYAIRLQQLPLALFGVAIAGALLPPLSRAIKSNNLSQFGQFLDFAIMRTLAFMIPVTMLLFIMGDGCIALIYGHGHFPNTSVVGTTQCLWGYTVGLIPMALVLILAPAFYARGDYRTPSTAAAASMLMNVALNTLMIAALGLGSASVAVATSVSAWFNYTWLAIALTKTAPFAGKTLTAKWLPSCRKILMATLLAACGVIAADYLVWGECKAVKVLQGQIPRYEIPFLSQILHLAASGTLFIAIFAAAGGWHFLFSKMNDQGRSRTSMDQADRADRVDEYGRSGL